MLFGLDHFRRNSPQAYLAAVGFALIALLVRMLLNATLGGGAPYFTFFVAVIASAALGGFWPGVSTAILGAVMASFFLPAGGWAHLIDPSDKFGPLRYLVSAVLVSYVCEVLISSRQRLKVSEAELKRSNADLEQFAFVVSHDMQEPLRTIKLHTQLVLRHLAEGRHDEMGRSAAFVEQNVDRMERQIQDLLAYSRISQEGLQPLPVDPCVAIREALRATEAMRQDAKAEVTFGAMPLVWAHETSLVQLFQNLISNGVKYCDADRLPVITLLSEVKGNEVLFTVEDNGIGMDPKYAEAVFQLFTRLNGRKYAGSGIGLAICKKIVEQFQGRIWVESEPGAGSRFKFTLRLARRTD